MIKRFLSILLLGSAALYGSAVLSGCAAVTRLQAGEPAISDDATPPSNYNPIYIHSVADLPADPAAVQKGLRFEISNVDSRDPNHIKVYAQLVDSNGVYLSGAAQTKYKNKICALTDNFANTPRNVAKYTMKEVTEKERVPTAVALLMDHSGSMGEERAHAIQDAADKLIDRKRNEDAFALLKYDEHVGVEAPPTTDTRALHNQLQKTGLDGYGRATAIVNGVATAMDQLAATQYYDRRAVVLFTDGVDNSSTLNKDSVLRLARKNNTLVCSIAFGENIDTNYLQGIATTTGGIYKQIYRTNEIDQVFDDLYHRLHNYYVFEYAPSDYGLHTVAVKLCLPHDTLIAQGAYDNSPNIGDVALLDVNFESDRADITSASMPAIDNVYTLMKAYPALSIEVRGHTDNSNNTGDPAYNDKLSQKRADAVKAALVKKGVQASRIQTKGFGSTQPIADNSTDEGKARNRRTEFLILSR